MGLTTTTPANPASWTLTSTQPVVNDLDCPASALCVAATNGGVLVTRTPTAPGEWAAAELGRRVAGVSCPSVQFCVGVGGDDVVYSTDPPGGAGAWHAVTIPGASMVAVDCPTSTLCIAVSNTGQALITTAPTGPAAGWASVNVGKGSSLDDIECASAQLCVAVDAASRAIASTNPTGGEAAWSQVAGVPDNVHDYSRTPGVACAPGGLCLVFAHSGYIAASATPASTGWATARVDGANHIRSAACPSVTLCVIGDNAGQLLTSVDPAGGAAAWSAPVPVDGTNGPVSPACPTAQLCVFADRAGFIFSTTSADKADPAWARAKIDPGHALIDLACPTAALCVATSPYGETVSSTAPASGVWSSPASAGEDLGSVSGVTCPSVSLCLLYNSTRLQSSANPAASTPTWSTSYAYGAGEEAARIVCPAPSACIAPSDDGGAVLTTRSPATPSAWLRTRIADGILADVSCPSLELCVMLGSGGISHASTDAFSAAPHWQDKLLKAGRWSRVACPSAGTCLAFDRWGQVASSPRAAAPVDRDAPVITVSSPTPGQHVALGAQVTPVFACDDGAGSGVASCSGPGTLDTASAGEHAFTVTAADRAGNTASVSVPYTVDAPANLIPATPQPSPTPTGPAKPVTEPRVTVAKRVSARTLKRGVKVTVTGLAPRSGGTLRAASKAKTVATVKAKADRAGKLTFKLRLPGRRAQRARGALKLTLTVVSAAGKKRTVKVTITVN